MRSAEALRPARRACIAVVALSMLAAGAAHAQAWPERTVRIVVPAPPGGGMDAMARAVAEQLAVPLKQSVVVDNRPGGNGVIATQGVARAAPDGYTLLLAASFHAINVWTMKKLPYDAVADFAGVARLGDSPLVFAASAQSGVRTVADFNAYVARQREPSFAVSVMETRLGAEAILQRLGLRGTWINYKGTGPAAADVAGGHVPFFVTTLASVLPFRDGGKIHLIGVTAKRRSPYLPEVPTLAEQGLDAEADVWYGLLAPAGTPADIVERVNREAARFAERPDYAARLRTLSIQPGSMAPAAFDAYLRAEVARFGAIVKAAKIEPE